MTSLVALLGLTCGLALTAAVWLLVTPAPPTGTRPNTAGWRSQLAGRFDRLTLRLALAVAAAVAIGAWTGWPVATLLAAAGGFLAVDYGRGQARARAQLARLEAIAGWTEMLRDTLSAAAGLQQAIRATAPLAPAPIRGEILTLARAVEGQQVPVRVALARLADDLDDPAGDLVVTALQLATRRQPGQLADLLGSLADTARAEVTMRQRVEAGRARIRASTRIITIFTIVFTAGLLLLNPAYLDAYRTLPGQAVLLLIAALDAAAYAWPGRVR
jgi:Flp pilus assembly protein TadB